MTIGEFLPIYLRNHVSTLKNHLGTSRRLERYVGQLAHCEMADVKRLQVIEWHRAIGETQGGNAANQALQQLHALYVKAQDWEVYDGKNPADCIKKFPKHSRERFVQSHEMPWLLASLSEEMPHVETFFLTLLLTGARRDEVRTMQWADIDFGQGLWHKPRTKTTAHTIPLPVDLMTRLQKLPRINGWVFPSSPNNKNGWCAGQWSVTAVEHHWRRIRKRGGLPDVRIHDLRRTAASWLSISGENLPVIQQMLNHTSLAATQVYARLSVAPVRRALDEQAERMLRSVSATPLTATEPEWPG